jgi:hypothetical protein
MKLSLELVAAMLAGTAAVLIWSGQKMRRIESLASFSRQYSGGRLGERLRIIHSVAGDRLGTLWIKAMGYLMLLTGGTLVATALYLVLARPEHLIR